jgi:hypothetical protein
MKLHFEHKTFEMSKRALPTKSQVSAQQLRAAPHISFYDILLKFQPGMVPFTKLTFRGNWGLSRGLIN